VWAKGLNAKDIQKEMFPAYGGKCLSRKGVHNWVEKSGKRFVDEEEDETEVLKRLRQVRRFLCCGFRHTGKAIGHVYQFWRWIRREINVSFPDSNITCFTFYIHL
jgi:hypothetical protein